MSVSADVFEIKSIKALQHWLAREQHAADVWYLGRHPCRGKCLLLSPKQSYDFRWDSWTVQTRMLQVAELPSINDAREWWFQYWEGEIVGSYFLREMSLVVLAKQAVWSAIPHSNMGWPKRDFLEFDFLQADGPLEKADCYAMQAEVQAAGISTRQLKRNQSEILCQRLGLKQE